MHYYDISGFQQHIQTQYVMLCDGRWCFLRCIGVSVWSCSLPLSVWTADILSNDRVWWSL